VFIEIFAASQRLDAHIVWRDFAAQNPSRVVEEQTDVEDLQPSRIEELIDGRSPLETRIGSGRRIDESFCQSQWQHFIPKPLAGSGRQRITIIESHIHRMHFAFDKGPTEAIALLE